MRYQLPDTTELRLYGGTFDLLVLLNLLKIYESPADFHGAMILSDRIDAFIGRVAERERFDGR